MSEQQWTCEPVEYRPIEGFPGYRVGNDGSVWSCRSINGRGALKSEWRKLSPCPESKGYMKVLLRNGGKPMAKRVHVLVLEAFVGPRLDGMEACHFPDRDKRNNCLDNLRWDTRQSNHDDKIIHGTKLIGEKNPRAKLTEASVAEIKSCLASGCQKTILAKKYGVSHTVIGYIGSGKIWKHVAMPNDGLARVEK